MTKNELAEAVASKTGISGSQARQAVETVIETVSDELASGGEVSLAGFGKFSVSQRAARQGLGRSRFTINDRYTFTIGKLSLLSRHRFWKRGFRVAEPSAGNGRRSIGKMATPRVAGTKRPLRKAAAGRSAGGRIEPGAEVRFVRFYRSINMRPLARDGPGSATK